MPEPKALLLAGLMLALVSACANQPAATSHAGGTPSAIPDMLNAGQTASTAIVINASSEIAGIQAEDAWIRTNLPGYRKAGQELLVDGKKPIDKIDLRAADGTEKSVYFDISGFFGKM